MNKGGQTHILVIDDNEDILSMLEAMLGHKGYYTTILDTTNGLIQIIKDIEPDLILMDKLLSGADGCEFCRLIKKDDTLKHVPIVMMSAHPQAAKECLAAGADFFVEKPFEMDMLLETIAGAINLK